MTTEYDSSMRGKLQPPAELSAPLLRLWRREFERFPAGYYVPADLCGMVLYLQTLAEYEAAQRIAARSREPAERQAARVEVRAVRRQLITLQRALRMYPSTRTHGDTHRNMARAPGQFMTPTRPGEAPWQQMFREAGNLPPNAKR